jgi:Ser/Thr protein kinase RdoA (MazF antagonist)
MHGPVLAAYGLDDSDCSISPFGNGLINHTWKIISADGDYLLQKINRQVFRQPEDILDNCRMLSEYLKTFHPDYLFVAPLDTTNGLNYVLLDDQFYRLFPFVTGSYSCDEVARPGLAFEAAKQFGRFTHLLSGFDPQQLHITLPDFHNLTLRFQQFKTALNNGNKDRISASKVYISFLIEQEGIVRIFEGIKKNPAFTIRVIHHDSKINNVLFDRTNDRGLCIIDLDTIMPGYYISDVGDMLRTYLSPAGEEERDFSKIEIREEYFNEIVVGYLGEMKSGLSKDEIPYFIYSGKFAIYMQALRFLTDYLNDDIYYNIQYEAQNFIRAGNQIVLLKKFIENEKRLNELLNRFLS